MSERRIRVRDVVAAMILSMLVGTLIEASVLSRWPLSEAVSANLGSVIQYACMFLLTSYVASQAGYTIRSIRGAPFRPFFLIQGLLYAVLLLGFSYGEHFVEVYLVALYNPEYAFNFWNFHAVPYVLQVSAAGYGMIVIAQCVVGPWVEEFVFRGLLLRACSARWSVVAGIVVSSILFAAMHYSRHYFLSTFVFGVVMCLLYLRFRSLWINALVHGVTNMLAFVMQFVLNVHWLKNADQLAQLASWWPEAVMLLVSTPLLCRFVAKSWITAWPPSMDGAVPLESR